MIGKKWIGLAFVFSSAFLLSACNLYKAPSANPPAGQQQNVTQNAEAANTISYKSSGFFPAEIKVKVGQPVTFKNDSGAAIQVNSAPHPTHTLYPELNIGAIAPGESKAVTFTTTGTKKYHNHLNPGNTGTIVVE